MREWLQKIFVYLFILYHISFFFCLALLYFVKLSSSFVVNFPRVQLYQASNHIYIYIFIYHIYIYIYMYIYVYIFCKTFFTHLPIPNFSFVCFHWKITWHLVKVNKKSKIERVSNWIEAQSSCLGSMSFNVRFNHLWFYQKCIF